MDRRHVPDRTALKAFLAARRAEIDPTDLELPPSRTEGSGRRAPGLTQDHMDHLTGRALGTYGRFECGRSRGAVPPEYVEQVARILHLDKQGWTTLWHLVYRHQPPHTLNPNDGMTIGGHWKEIVTAHPHPCYANDLAWNVLAHNTEFASLFPGREAPRNTMEWMVLSPYARETGLYDWENSWARMVLPQLRAACNEYRENLELADLQSRVEADPVAGPLYRSMPDAYYQQDGDTRQMWDAGQNRLISVTIAPSMPLGAPGARLMFLLPDYRADATLRR
ncbi:XRE family transcriptional regulator [Kitasatospora sp. NPDC087315]|uniref:MmyB family transcriptional regulator n=1 Tax=Kitasatospora sp. NPDC087315 TaxID=3364069 RepID=UPI0037FC0337